MNFKTADLCDAFGDGLQVCEPVFADFGGRARFHGAVATVKCFEDNSRVREAVAEPGGGRVLVVDAGASPRCAMLGDVLAAMATANGWAGVVLFGMIRDSAEIAAMDLGVKALGTHPRKSVKRGQGDREVPVRFAGVQFVPGSFVYADEDGIVCSGQALPVDAD